MSGSRGRRRPRQHAGQTHTWRVQAQAGPVTTEALEAIINRAAVPILDLLQDQSPEAVAALAPSVVRVILAAMVEVVAEEQSRQG